MKKHKNLNKKTQNRCEFCSKLGTNNDFIHKKCAIPYLKSQGYDIIKFKSPVEYLEEAFIK